MCENRHKINWTEVEFMLEWRMWSITYCSNSIPRNNTCSSFRSQCKYVNPKRFREDWYESLQDIPTTDLLYTSQLFSHIVCIERKFEMKGVSFFSIHFYQENLKWNVIFFHFLKLFQFYRTLEFPATTSLCYTFLLQKLTLREFATVQTNKQMKNDIEPWYAFSRCRQKYNCVQQNRLLNSENIE